MNVQTYLYFDGRCEEAIEFYVAVFGATPAFLMRYKDGPKELMPAGGEEQVFHATVTFGETALNFSDVAAEGGRFESFSLLVHLDTAQEADQVFEALKVGGHIRVPMGVTPWATRYGIVKDRFGVTWKLQVNQPASLESHG